MELDDQEQTGYPLQYSCQFVILIQACAVWFLQLLTWLDLLISVSDRLFCVLTGKWDILRLPLTLSRPPLTSFCEVEISAPRKAEVKHFIAHETWESTAQFKRLRYLHHPARAISADAVKMIRCCFLCGGRVRECVRKYLASNLT